MEEETGSGGWPQCLSALAQGSTQPCARKELGGLDKPLPKCRALVFSHWCLKALTGEFGGFVGVFLRGGSSYCVQHHCGCVTRPGSAGNNLYRGYWGGLGFGF